jgi:hypothetical protein
MVNVTNSDYVLINQPIYWHTASAQSNSARQLINPVHLLILNWRALCYIFSAKGELDKVQYWLIRIKGAQQ